MYIFTYMFLYLYPGCLGVRFDKVHLNGTG